MKNVKTILYAIIAIIMFNGFLERYIPIMVAVDYVPDILLLLLLLFSKRGKKGFGRFVGKWAIFAFELFLIFGLSSAIIHGVALHTVVWGLRMVIRAPLLAYLMYRFFTHKDVEKMHRWLYPFFHLNALLCCVDFINGNVSDYMGGCFAGNGRLALFLLAAMTIFTFDFTRDHITRKRYGIYVILSMAIAVLAEVKMLYFLLPVSLFLSYVVSRGIRFHKYIVPALIASSLLIPTLRYVLSFYYDDEYIEQTLDSEKMEEYNNNSYGFTDRSYNRGNCIQLTNEELLDGPDQKLLGHGLGSGSSSGIFATEIYTFHKETFYYYFTLSYVLVETGWIGLFFFVSFYFLILWRFYRYYSSVSHHTNTRYWLGIGLMLSFYAMIFLYYSSIAYTDFYIEYILLSLVFIAMRDETHTNIGRKQLRLIR